MRETPIDRKVVDEVIASYHIPDFGKATIREMVAMASMIEQKSGESFIRMEMGVPGLPPLEVGVEAQIEALQSGCASVYPIIDGLPKLKEEGARFVKAFIDVEVSSLGCVPVTGSMQGTYASFVTASQAVSGKDTILFIDPGFPVQKQQLTVIGVPFISFDVYNYRGEALRAKLDSYLSQGNIAAIIYSNPNNPAWICLTDSELKIIGDMANQYDTIVLEDLAYFAMDFRKDFSEPFAAPFQPSVAKYTDNYILLISGSKAFSYAGERIGMVAISDKLYHRAFSGLTARYGGGTFGTVFVHRVLYALTSGCTHSSQYALAAMFKAASDGACNFVEMSKEYGRRAEKLKAIFVSHGFEIVYDKDLDEPVGDGFYFTIGYPGMSGGELMKELMYYGVSAISLSTTGSEQQGLRACTSFIKDHQYELLNSRLEVFEEHHLEK